MERQPAPAGEPTEDAAPDEDPDWVVEEADEESFPASDPPAQWSGPGGTG
ncbi:MAG TPA: hypothetical protein VHW47_07475 [Acidimicrobiales bacterium]|nr:hypothetical protein [Acidimicrobiales bacterium]